MLSVQKITKEYNNKIILNKISFSLLRGERVGLIAPNGTGKSTLLKIIAGEDKTDSGSIIFQKNITTVYFPQETPEDVSISDYLGVTEKTEGDLVKLFEKVNLGNIPLNITLSKLSGGQRSKISLVKIFATKADLYLLDEPTNNLDFDTLKVMERFITSQGSAFIIISHDREFLDRTVDKIFEIGEFDHSIRIYSGGYSDYLEQHEARIQKEWGVYEDAQGKSKKMKIAIDKKIKDVGRINKEVNDRRKLATNITDKKSRTQILDRAGKIAKQGKSIKSRLQSYNLDEVKKPESRLPVKLQFEDIEPSGSKVFSVVGVEKTIGSKHLGPIDLNIRYGDKVLIIGDNGVGKTTFLKILTGEITPDRGEVEKGTKLSIGYLPQITNYDQNSTTLSFFKKYIPEKSEGDTRKILNRFNLTENDISKTLSELSPGLRSRLVLAVMMALQPNCIILDEPSNHLDLEVLEKLEGALMKYDGTVVLVSHDRRLIKKIEFTKIYNLTNEGVLEDIVDVDKYI